ncbi:MAG TPA: radical SAM protein [Candidatus Obscuribacterales bacterium]
MSSSLVVGLVQITEPMERLYYLPYSIGLLQCYAQAHASAPERYAFLPPVFLREPFATVQHRLEEAQILGLSAYIWNIRYTLALAQRLKAQDPRRLVIFGGPQVPDRAENFLRAHPFIDVCVHGEGELAFLKLLEAWPGKDWQGIPGISWIDADDRFHGQGKAERLKDLDAIPSPYLEGFFEPLFREFPNQKWLAPWESNRGCPFSCTFCDWGSIQSKVHRFSHERVLAEIDWFGRQGIEILYSCDANFGMLPRDLEFAQALVDAKQNHGYPHIALLQMTKNQAGRTFQTFKLLSDAGMIPSATLSMQSVTPSVLQAIKRDNISLKAYHELLARFVGAGIPTYTDILIGLPGESFDSFIDCIDAVISQGQHEDVRFWNSYLLPNAEMSDPDYRRKFAIESVEVPSVSAYVAVREPVEGIQERMEMVIATNTLSRLDWLRTRMAAWLAQILYYGKFLQLPLLLIHELAGISHRDLLLAFLEGPLPPNAVVLPKLRAFLSHKGQEMLAGKPELHPFRDFATGTPVWLPCQAFVLTELLYNTPLDQAYAECLAVLSNLLDHRGAELPPGLLVESLVLGQAHFQSKNPLWHVFNLDLHYNLWDCYRRILLGQPVQLESGNFHVSHTLEAGEMRFREQVTVNS